ncbi:ORF2 [torque teno Delphinidae virus 51]
MGLTGELKASLTQHESNWLTMIYCSHSMFCDCGEPVEHLLRLLKWHISEGDGFEDDLISFAMDQDFEDGGGDPGSSVDGTGAGDLTGGYVDAV